MLNITFIFGPTSSEPPYSSKNTSSWGRWEVVFVCVYTWASLEGLRPTGEFGLPGCACLIVVGSWLCIWSFARGHGGRLALVSFALSTSGCFVGGIRSEMRHFFVKGPWLAGANARELYFTPFTALVILTGFVEHILVKEP